MRAPGYLALRTVCALFLLLHQVEGSNSTATDTTPKYTGWQKGPAERGTMTILWSCLTTVFACTWTILHLNVPSVRDRTSIKLWRKIKWMAITVIFPEFIFAKAVCELQMAIEDLHELKKQEDTFGWDVEYGRGCRLLYWLFHSRTPSSSLPIPAVAASGIEEVNIEVYRSKKWTLTHSYLANMGGIIVQNPSNEPPIFGDYALVTAHALTTCCVPNKHSLGDLYLTKEEILDKSKADNLLKTVAALQILWLIVSVITRKVYNLPISLLEVCTVAFAALAVATYVTNLAKPKDVDVPVTLISESRHEDNFYFNGESFFARTVRPAKVHVGTSSHRRIKNDMLRLQSHGTQYVTLTYALAMSTMCFGAIHCGAWQSYFPSQVERRLWQVASVLSSTLPLINLLFVSTSNLMLGRQAHKIIATTKSLMESLMRSSSEPTSGPVPRTNLTRIKLWSEHGKLWVERDGRDGVGFLAHVLAKCIVSLIEVNKGVEKGEGSRTWCKKYLESFDTLVDNWPNFAYDLELDDPLPRDGRPWSWTNTSLNESDLSIDAISLALQIINHSSWRIRRFHEQWDLFTGRVNRISTLFAWLTGFLYATARLILLAVALAAFRKQNEDLYIDTWARFMPSWR